ncbi:MAG: AraC family transcriptional regulator [Lachnospiraceae bacterium]|nr:AraC family transcriptional regulator [Lachnospiraceae bacterium]
MTECLFQYDRLYLNAAYHEPDEHRHLLSHIIVGASQRIRCSVNHYEFEADGVCIDSDVLHTACVEEGELLICLFDKTSLFASELSRRYLKGQNYAVLDGETVQKIRNVWLDTRSLLAVDEAITNMLGIEDFSLSMDVRIQNALEILKSHESVEPDTISKLAAEAGISVSRFSHLFKENVGIALRRYLALEKIRKSYIHLLKSGNITDAAMMAGFDSPSHLAATCKRMFGISLTDFMKS